MTPYSYLGATFYDEDGVLCALIPGVNANPEGDTFEEIKGVAREMLEEIVHEQLQQGLPVSSSWTAEQIIDVYGDLGSLHFFDVEVTVQAPAQRINVSIPGDVLARMDAAKVKNRSAFFAEAAMEKLQQRA